MKQEDLKILIDKFMSGTTTLDEEKALGDFFRQNEHVPAELDPYREMFAYFDNGMTGEPSGKPVRHTAPVWSLRWIAGIAAAVAVIFVAAYHLCPAERMKLLSCRLPNAWWHRHNPPTVPSPSPIPSPARRDRQTKCRQKGG